MMETGYEALLSTIAEREPRDGFTARDIALTWADCAEVLRADPQLIHEIDLDGAQIADALTAPTIDAIAYRLAARVLPAILSECRAKVLRDLPRELERRDEELASDRAMRGFYGARPAFEEG